MNKLDSRILIISVGVGIFVWLADAAMDYLLLYHGTTAASFMKEFLSHELNHGVVILVCFTAIGLIYSRLIAKQKGIEEDLRVNDQILQSAQRIAHIGSWHLDINKNRLQWSDEVYRIFGVQPQEFGATYEAFLATVHPDDRELVNRTYTNSIMNKVPYEVVHRIIRPDGEIRVVHEKSEDISDEAGNITHSIGIVHDITELKIAEEEKEKLISQLQKSLSEIKTLRGIVPICSFCKKIRDDKGFWDQVEVYIRQHTEADFSHCICPDCMTKHYPGV